MADPTFIHQQATLVGGDGTETDLSQQATLVGGDDASAKVSQQAALAGVDDANTFVSQQVAASGADDAGTFVSQFVLLVGRGPEVVPPGDAPLGTFTVGFGGLAVNWWIVPAIADDDVELRSKVIKSVRVTGKVTGANAKVYTYQPTENINIEDLEDGVNAAATVALTDTTQVVQSERFNVNCPNAVLETVRVEGLWRGSDGPDRIDEICWERAVQGVRR